MNRLSRCPVWAVACVGACLSWSAAAQPGSNECEKAWANYNQFKQLNVMDPSQYAVTVHGAAVRAACGKEALPVAPGTDTPYRHILRKPASPVKPPEKPKAPTPPEK